ncbi:MAG TPA: PEP-CTERM sorting domain-containing protein [Opitutus sp.]|nr:PEP-CTERM sorting domain-containing protein [Opitutus sp.]
MKTRPRLRAVVAILLGAVVARLPAQTTTPYPLQPGQTVVPFDLNNVTITLYQGDGTSDTSWVSYPYDLYVEHDGANVSLLWADLGSWGSASPAFALNGEISLSSSSASTTFYLRLSSDFRADWANRIRIDIAGLRPLDPDYVLAGGLDYFANLQHIVSGTEDYYTTTYENDLGLFSLERDFEFSVDPGSGTGTLTFLPQHTAFASVNMLVMANLVAVDVSAVPEPSLAAGVLMIGAGGFVLWRRRRERVAGETNVSSSRASPVTTTLRRR